MSTFLFYRVLLLLHPRGRMGYVWRGSSVKRFCVTARLLFERARKKDRTTAEQAVDRFNAAIFSVVCAFGMPLLDAASYDFRFH